MLPRQATTVIAALGALLIVVAVAIGMAAVETQYGSCGTWFAPSGPDDLVGGPACDAAQRARGPLVLVPGVLGLLMLVPVVVGRAVNRLEPATGSA